MQIYQTVQKMTKEDMKDEQALFYHLDSHFETLFKNLYYHDLPKSYNEDLYYLINCVEEGKEEEFYHLYFELCHHFLRNKQQHQYYPSFDLAYLDLILDVVKNGTFENEEDTFGIVTDIRGKYESDNEPAPTKRVLNRQIRLNNRGDIANVLTSKKQAVKDPIIELYWIMIMQSNDVNKLLEMGCKVWKQWMISDELEIEKNGYNIGTGTIGTSYGYQIGSKTRRVPLDEVSKEMILTEQLKYYVRKPIDWEELKTTGVLVNQLEYVIYSLRKNPLSRRIKTTLFNFEDLDTMQLEPCVYETHWQVINGEIELTVNIRSNDMGLGHPYNVHQYSVLHKLVSKVVGIPTGDIVFNIDNVHVYGRHIEQILEQLKEDITDTVGLATVEIDDFGENIYNFRPEMVKVINYKGVTTRRYEVVI